MWWTKTQWDTNGEISSLHFREGPISPLMPRGWGSAAEPNQEGGTDLGTQLTPPWPRFLTLYLFATRLLLYLFSIAITLVTALMTWLPVFHLQWLGHIPQVRYHLPTSIGWNSPIKELIGPVLISSLLLPACGALSHLMFFQLPSTFLPSLGRSITTLEARWHDFFFFFLLYSTQFFFSPTCTIYYFPCPCTPSCHLLRAS